jgi:hypothetical protein
MDVSQRVTQQPHLQKVPLKFRQRLQSWHRPITEVYFPDGGIASVVAVVGGERRQAEVAITGREGMSGLPIALGTDGSPQRGAGDRLTGARRVRSGSTGLTCVCQGQSRGGQRRHRGWQAELSVARGYVSRGRPAIYRHATWRPKGELFIT